MNQTSSAITGGITMTAAGVAPLITWAIDGFSKPVPNNVPLILAAALVTIVHLIVNRINSRKAAPSAPQPTDKAAP